MRALPLLSSLFFLFIEKCFPRKPKARIIENMNETLYLSYAPRLKPLVEKVQVNLKAKGYSIADVDPSHLEGKLVLLLLDLDSSVEEIYASAPFIKEQYDYSSLKAMRLMPFLIFASSKGSIEDQVEDGFAEVLEEVISGEFKPYGYDVDAEDPLFEFASVLETYEE